MSDRVVRLVSFPISVGIVPVTSPFIHRQVARALRLPISEGIVPVILGAFVKRSSNDKRRSEFYD